MSHAERVTELDIGTPPEGHPEWESFRIHIHNYEDHLQHIHIKERLTFFRCDWIVVFYPNTANPGHGQGEWMGVQLNLRDPDDSPAFVAVEGEIKVKDRDGNDVEKVHFTCDTKINARGRIVRLLMPNTAILDPSNNILRDGTLTIEICMRKLQMEGESHRASFIPPNPIKQSILKMFLDEETADVLFKVDSNEFYAHRIILQACAPDLAALCADYKKLTPVPISNVEPRIFHSLLYYVYGGDVSAMALKEHAAEIIEACDRYDVPNLKLLAEGHYINANPTTVDNVIDQLHYAHRMNLALLKEKVVEFMVDNATEVLEKASLKTAPSDSGILASVLAAVSDKNKKTCGGSSSDIKSMGVSSLRRLLHEKGHCVDGSRESLIAALEKEDESKGKKRKR